jgi:hypothetical protein
MALLWRDREQMAHKLTLQVLTKVGDRLDEKYRMKYAQEVDPEHDEGLLHTINEVVFNALLEYEGKVQADQTPTGRA